MCQPSISTGDLGFPGGRIAANLGTMRIFVVFMGIALVGLASVARAATGPCDLVTKAEVKQAVGAEVSEGKPNPHNKAVCDFKIGDTGSVLNVSLTDKTSADTD